MTLSLLARCAMLMAIATAADDMDIAPQKPKSMSDHEAKRQKLEAEFAKAIGSADDAKEHHENGTAVTRFEFHSELVRARMHRAVHIPPALYRSRSAQGCVRGPRRCLPWPPLAIPTQAHRHLRPVSPAGSSMGVCLCWVLPDS